MTFEMAVGLAMGVLGACATRLVYRAISSEWPASYAGARSILEHHARGSFLRYSLFRLLPLLATSLAFVSTSSSLGYNYVATAAALAIAYGLMTDIRALVTLRLHRRRRAQLALLYCLGLATTATTALLSVLAIEQFQPWIPPPQDLVFAAWTAAFAAIASVGLQRAMQQDLYPNPLTVAELETQLGKALLGAVQESARFEDCDPVFLQAILATELEQRPKWFRRLEPIVSRVSRRGTYGIAQVESGKALSDVESVQLLARRHHGFHLLYSKEGYLRTGPLAAELEKHNSDPVFVERALAHFYSLNPSVYGSSETIGADGRPSLVIHTVKRIRDRAALTGTYIGEHGVRVFSSLSLTQGIPGSCRREEWALSFPIQITQVDFELEPLERVTVNVSWLT